MGFSPVLVAVTVGDQEAGEAGVVHYDGGFDGGGYCGDVEGVFSGDGAVDYGVHFLPEKEAAGGSYRHVFFFAVHEKWLTVIWKIVGCVLGFITISSHV